MCCLLATALSALGSFPQTASSQTKAPLPMHHARPPVPTAPSTKLLNHLNRLRRAPRGAQHPSYSAPDPTLSRAYQHAVSNLLRDPQNSKPPPGYAIAPLPSHSGLWLLAENGLRSGSGAVVVRAPGTNCLLIEAPHTFFDAGTLPIALAVFEQLQARALLLNTLHRAHNQRRSGHTSQAFLELARGGQLESDVARNPNTLYNAAHSGMLDACDTPTTVQIHGFRDERVPSFDIVISAAGTSTPLASIQRALQLQLPRQRIGAYPTQLRDLGGTKNVQAQASRARHAHFLHIELSSSMRRRLLANHKTLVAFANGLRSLGAAKVP